MSAIDDTSDKNYQDYKKRIREIEDENDAIGAQLSKARHHIKRLRVERIVLLEEIDELRQGRSSRVKKSGSALGSLASTVNGAGAESDSEMSVSESIMSDVKGGPRKGAPATTAPRKKRDPNAPKGPGNVFFLYCRMERDNIKDEVPNESLGEVTRLLGQKWKALTKEQKQKYYDIYKKEQEEYESAMKSYTAAGGGIEGAAAVEAANKVRREEEGGISGGGDQDEEEELDDEEDEIDMLQDDEEEEEEDGHLMDEDLDDLSVDNSKPFNATAAGVVNQPHLQVQNSIVSPPSSIATDHSLPATPKQQDINNTITTSNTTSF